MRLNLYLAKCGVASRRKADALIQSGRISVNGKIVRKLGTQVSTDVDQIFFDNKLLELKTAPEIILLNKPAGYLSTVSDPFRRSTVMELVPDIPGLVPVGRLDLDTEGVLLLSNDGSLNYRLTHPRYQIDKVYQVTVDGVVRDDLILRLEQGVDIGEDRPAFASGVKKITSRQLRLTLHEGRKRQVKRMMESLGLQVTSLRRERFAFLTCGQLEKGSWRYLTQEEIHKLKKMVGL